MRLRYVKADPAGNITLLVTSAVPANARAEISNRLMASIPGTEQAGFITEPLFGGCGRLDMMGGEFCGNAARAFARWLTDSAAFRQAGTPISVDIEISGHDGVLTALVDDDAVTVPMPAPLTIRTEAGIKIVEFPGITHYILSSPPGAALAESLLSRYKNSADAVGILFLRGDHMTPFVWVRETGSAVWESSCGSGTAACAAAALSESGRSDVRLTLKQPGGTLGASASRDGEGMNLSIFGPVTVYEEQEIEI